MVCKVWFPHQRFPRWIKTQPENPTVSYCQTLAKIKRQTVNLKEINIHDSQILKVIENCQNDTLDLVLEYPVDYEKNIFEKRTLRFFDFLNYKITEIPFGQLPTILEFNDLGTVKYSIGTGRSQIEIERQKVEFKTNCGNRTLEYKKVELLNMDFEKK